MRADRVRAWARPGQSTPVAFFGAGVLVLGHAATMGVRAFTELATPVDVLAPAGHLLAVLGLLGVYATLTDRNATLARCGAAAAALAAGGWFTVSVSQFGRLVGIVLPATSMLPDAVSALVIVSTVLAYVLLGVTTHCGRRTSWPVGLLLLAPAALFLVLIASVAVTGASALWGLVVGTGLALSHLAIGHSLRTAGGSTDRVGPAADAAV